MLSECIEKIRAMAVEATSPKVRTNVQDDMILLHSKGGWEYINGIPARRNHVAHDLTAICAASQEDKDNPRHSVWYSRKSVVLIYDHDERRDRMTLTLAEHPVLQRLRELEQSKEAFSQDQFVRLFRVFFDRFCEAPVLETMRRIAFKKNEEGQSVIGHGKASVGRALQAEMTGAREIPESVTLDIPVFAGGALEKTFSVECVIDIDPSKETFQLYPFPGAIDEALSEAEAELYSHLAEGCADGARLYYGAP